MLSIVQSCQELQNQRVQDNLKQVDSSKFEKESKNTNFFTVLKGIMPGKYYSAILVLIYILAILCVLYTNLFLMIFNQVLHFSGTKWCGIDDIANNYFDLGKEVEVDKCCRAHDHCPMKIKALGSSYGIKNNHPYTK